MPRGAALRGPALAFVAALIAGGLGSTAVVQRLEARTVDARYAARKTAPVRGIVVVAIDERSLAGETWPLPRRRHAAVVRRLAAADPRAIVYDVQFTEGSGDEAADLALYDAFGAAGGAILATSTSVRDGSTSVFGGDANVRAIDSRAAAANFRPDSDGVIRGYERRIGRVATIASATASRVAATSPGGGARARIDFRGPSGSFPTVSFADVVAGRVPAAALRGRIVIVGATAPTLQDQHTTPFGAGMSGPELQANAIWTALHGNPLRDAPAWVTLLAAALLALVPIALGRRLPVAGAVAIAVLAGVGATLAALLAFDAGVVVGIVVPMLALLLGVGWVIASGYAAEVRGRRRIAGYSVELEAKVRERTAELRATQVDLVRRLASAVELRDESTGMHLERMSMLCEQLALETGMSALDAEELRVASLLHDIGKIGIPDRVLRKPGELTDDEIALMREHTRLGGDVLAGSTSSLLSTAETIARTHHEHWDGNGYPHGLAGEQIPAAGRIAAICDVYDALVSERLYKPAWSSERALAELQRGAGAQFDPRFVELFCAIVPRIDGSLAQLGEQPAAPPVAERQAAPA